MRTVRNLLQKIKSWLDNQELLEQLLVVQNLSHSKFQVALVDVGTSPYVMVQRDNLMSLSVNTRERSVIKIWLTLVVGQVTTSDENPEALQLATLLISELNKHAKKGVISTMLGENDEVFLCYHVPISWWNSLCKDLFISFLESVAGEVHHLHRVNSKAINNYMNQQSFEAEFELEDSEDEDDEEDNQDELLAED